ncbi:unnamed protein product [Clonostachys chloroleuca]|uniref:Uncharacterized protein n=1 Tax=Clonostachys chloroleuca TaxID=1926264 RepID=A0AA35VEL9_9HYPO|nr:unnamed protein product [Clonostachys chloroleuca]
MPSLVALGGGSLLIGTGNEVLSSCDEVLALGDKIFASSGEVLVNQFGYGVIVAAGLGAPAVYATAWLGWRKHWDDHELAVRKDKREQEKADEKMAKKAILGTRWRELHCANKTLNSAPNEPNSAPRG